MIPEWLIESVHSAYVTPGDVIVDPLLIDGRGIGVVYNVHRMPYSFAIDLATPFEDGDHEQTITVHSTSLVGRLRGAHVVRRDFEWRMDFNPGQLRIQNVPGDELIVAMRRTFHHAHLPGLEV